MRVIIYCENKKACDRVRQALVRQGIAHGFEKHQIPKLEWVFEAESQPRVKNWEGCKIELDMENSFQYIF